MQGTDWGIRRGSDRMRGKQAACTGCHNSHFGSLQKLPPLLANDLPKHVHLPDFIELV
jgi:predicted CXXCH cytochrome family protein